MQSDQFHSRFAIALLGQAKDPAVAGVLFGYVTLDAAISLPEGVPDEAFSNAVGKSPATVATAAAATRDEALLKKFARDTRTTVRRVVAANPATGLE